MMLEIIAEGVCDPLELDNLFCCASLLDDYFAPMPVFDRRVPDSDSE